MRGCGRFHHWALLLPLVAALLPRPSAAVELAIVAHVHTPASGGDHAPDEIAAMLAAERLDGAIITDHDRLEIEWGLPFLRHFARYRYRRTSIETEGVARYAGAIRTAADRHPGLLLVPGIEANPYYRIEVDPLRFRVRVLGLHEHVLAVGLAEDALLDAPSVPNGFHPSVGRWTIAGAGAALVLVAAAAVAWLRSRPTRLRAIRVRRRRVWPAVAATVLLGLAVVDWLALRASVFHPYGEDAGAAPFQRFIDWVGERGGLTFWAHPGVDETMRRGPIEVVTRPYFAHLAATDRYAGFGGGRATMLGPGGLWDRLLAESCAGRRERPPWFLAQADFRHGPSRRLWYAVNHVSAAERTEVALLEAIRAGRFYTTHSHLGRRWRLGAFRAESDAAVASSGERLEADGPATVIASLVAHHEKPPPLRVRIFASGTVLLDRWISGSETLRLEEPDGARGCRWYRLVAGRSSEGVHLVSNPVFVTGSGEGPR